MLTDTPISMFSEVGHPLVPVSSYEESKISLFSKKGIIFRNFYIYNIIDMQYTSLVG